MSATLALVRAGWRANASYRIRLIISILSLTVTVVPVYFVAHALQPVMADAIRTEGGQYFGFLILGMAAFLLLPAAIRALPDAIGSGISTGTFETLLGTPARLPAILTGLVGFNILWTALRAAILILTAWILGASFEWAHVAPAALILALITLAHAPFGVIGAALVIAFRTTGPLPQAVLGLSALLGGVYYPTSVIPSWIRTVADFVPLTYGLRALRRVLLEGQPLLGVLPDLAALLGFATFLAGIAALAITAALRYARRAGTLAQY